jgi:beta-lactamase superfamily II metal-dependent hydrolase
MRNTKEKPWRMALLAVVGIAVLLAIAAGIKYRSEAKDHWTMTNYPDASGNQGMFYTLYNEKTGALIVIDGGWEQNEQQVREAINRYGGTVDAWFITHYHNDHVDAFNQIWKNPQGIVIKQVYDSPMNYEEYVEVAHEWDFVDSFTAYRENTKGAENVSHLYRGDVLGIGSLTVTVLNSYDDKIKEAGSTDIPNDASLVLKFEGEEDSVLFCADCHSPVMADLLLSEYTPEQLHAEYVQLGHHGNNSFPTYFYDVVDPQIALFDAPEWLMTGENYTAKDMLDYFNEKSAQSYDYRTAPNEFVIR